MATVTARRNRPAGSALFSSARSARTGNNKLRAQEDDGSWAADDGEVDMQNIEVATLEEEEGE